MSVLPYKDSRKTVSGVQPVDGAATEGSDEPIAVMASEGGAWEAGRRLAADPRVTQPEPDSNEAVINALYRCRSIVMRWGIEVDIVRTRRGCAVVRVISNSNESYLLAKSAFEAIPANLGLGHGVVVEATRNDRGRAGHLCTLLWTSPATTQAAESEVVVPEVTVLPTITDDAGVVPGADVTARKNEPAESPHPIRPAPPFFETLASYTPIDTRWSDTDVPPAQGGATEAPADLSAQPLFSPPPPPPPPPPPSPPPPPKVATSSVDGAALSAGPVAGDSKAAPQGSVTQPPNSWVSTVRPIRPGGAGLPNRPNPVADTTRIPTLPAVKKTRRPPWLWRRAWILVLTVVAGVVGAQVVTLGHAPTYTAQATLLVQSGAGASGPGAANDAAALAITDAAFIPTDGATLKAAARVLNVPEAQVSSNLAVSAESGTSVLVLTYTAPTAAEAVKAAAVVARIVAQPPSGSGIPGRSISVVRVPVTATPTSSLLRYALAIGGILGLAVGLIVVMAVERSDPRLDDASVVSEVFHCPSNALPEEIGLPELARALALAVDSSQQLTVLPLERSDRASATSLAAGLRQVWPPDMAIPSMSVSSEFEASAIGLSQGTGPTVVVLAPGASKRRASTVAERLHLIKRNPMWAVVMGRVRSSRNVS